MRYPAKPRDKTSNWRAYNQALKSRGSLTVWFDADMEWEATPSGKRGRQQTYSEAAIQACLTLKVLFGLPLRQATGFIEFGLNNPQISDFMQNYGDFSRFVLQDFE